MKEKIVFNHFYKLKHDLKRSYIISPDSGNYNIKVHHGLISKIHPVYAMIFSFFSNPVFLEEVIDDISFFLDMSKEDVENFVSGLIGNEEFQSSKSKDGTFNSFPPNILIEEKDAFIKGVLYTPTQFTYKELDLKCERLYSSPVGVLFMVNNTCATECCYCYADKKTKPNLLPFDRIKAIIKNAYEANVLQFMFTGGEVLLYRHWKELVQELINYNYDVPLISTKLPVKETDIDFIKKHNISIQVSLDSLNRTELYQILNVNPNYCDRMKQSIILLDQKGVSFQVATIVTNYNDRIENFDELYTFLSNFKNLRRWEIRIAFRSLHSRDEFDEIKISRESERRINEWIQTKKENTEMNILWSPSFKDDRYFKSEGGSRNFVGARCSANYSHMVFMPDGKVTICEQLYWNPRFIIGDLSTQSIEEVWNSPRALELAFPKKENFRNDSACKKCSIFDTCYTLHNKCYADVLKAYGDENWDYPDPRCIDAPPFIHDLLTH
ncbi:hypothetical protein FACS1894182_12920 [Bacteroidia bacterium]|nr:hypothetical protein FACS1894182_12920 [Bacteroidia bacterium]